MTDKQEKQIAVYMKNLGISREEAIELLQDDDDIDHDKEKAFDLPKEKLKEVTKSCGKREYKKDPNRKKQERPKDTIKIGIIAELAKYLKGRYSDVAITNESKLITFTYEGDTYEIDLKRKRKEKGKV